LFRLAESTRETCLGKYSWDEMTSRDFPKRQPLMRRLIAFFLPPFTRRSYPYLDSGTMLMPAKTFDWKGCAGALVCLTVCAERSWGLREWDPGTFSVEMIWRDAD
jgi:hypothetical protein